MTVLFPHLCVCYYDKPLRGQAPQSQVVAFAFLVHQNPEVLSLCRLLL